MSDLYYTTNFGVGTSLCDGKEIKIPKELENSYKNLFSIQVFGDTINPKHAKNPLFTCRNLIANIHCEYVGTDRNSKAIKASHIAEACNKVDNLYEEDTKEVVIINCFTYDESDEQVSEVLKYLYEIIVIETMKTFGSSDNIVIYWYLNNEESKIVDKQTEWNSKINRDANGCVILTHKE